MTRLVRYYCWLMATVLGVRCVLDLLIHASRTERGIDEATFAIWFVGAVLITELQKWRKL